MRRIALLLTAAVLTAGCEVPSQPDLEAITTVPSFDVNDRDAVVVRVAAPTGNPAVDVPNIQAAVDAATPGALIQFARGTYAIEQATQIVVSVPEVTLHGHRQGTTIRGVASLPPDAPFWLLGHFLLNGGDQTVRRLTFEGFLTALSFGAPGTSIGGYRVEDCTFRLGFNAVSFVGFSENVSTVRGNEFINTNRPIEILGKTVHVRRNRVTAPDPAAMLFGQPFFAAYVATDFLAGGTISENNVFEKNTVVGYADGFTFDAFPGEVVRNNVVRQNEFIGQRLYGIFPPPPFFNGTMVWFVSAGRHEGNRIQGNVLRGSEGLGIVLEEGSDNWIVDNNFSDLPGQSATAIPFSGTAIYLGEATSGNRVRGNEFENVVNTIVDLGTGNIIKDKAKANLAAVSSLRLSVPREGSRPLDHPRLRFLRPQGVSP